MYKSSITKFLEKESSGGIILVIAALCAIIIANSPFGFYYDQLLSTLVRVQVGELDVAKPLLLWVNDGLMAIFFLLVGLELKREFLEGELSDKKSIIMPGLGALGGMIVPAGIYIYFNINNPDTIGGWAIPAATDIAFALGVLSLLGSRVPISLKIFLTSLAIFDDVGAILIIAFFYTSKVSMTALIISGLCIVALAILNKRGVFEKSLYIMFGVIMWVSLLKSGVHATLAGVILAVFIPLKCEREPGISPLKTMEHDLHAVVAFFILPVFAFCNSGINFSGISLDDVLHPMPLGIILGLFIGKQVGIFGLCWIGIKMKITELPKGMSMTALYGTAALCGIGYTMSLFIGSLAFEDGGVGNVLDERIGILIGSLMSGLLGFFILNKTLKAK
ncbi:MAG: Na+/H+ antiporter NhaA [Kordiimonadaceae bacterium]|jgi:Na+:H+ antiporter, NhaA family|nr:Na+/H+ antiporter NhaA [Kordiimonadaceae bacterium]MBT6032050.1 Na+/H+ antiporter NhaA [Kordiimonadaceae bacterium]